MTGSKADYLLLLLPTVYSKVFTQQLLLLVLFLVPASSRVIFTSKKTNLQELVA